jgi:hypothetical protein
LSIRAEIVCGILKNVFLGVGGKNPLKKMLRKLIFSFTLNIQPKIPFFGPLKMAIP